MTKYIYVVVAFHLAVQACSLKKNSSESSLSGIPDSLAANAGDSSKRKVIFDSDTNNELDDQHALAYLLFSGDQFDLAGVTVNSTRNGGKIEGQYAEAERVMKLCGFQGSLPIYKGANSTFDTIRKTKNKKSFDGEQAVQFIIDQAKKPAAKKLVIIAVGKLTNLALALETEPSIANNIRLVWLGSNYPEPGEYNQDNDTASLNYILNTKIDFEIITVRYGKGTGSDVVRITKEEVNRYLKGKGPVLQDPVVGRHGGTFSTFGDYAVSLFENAHYNGTPPSRALFDMVAVAMVKNARWGQRQIIPAPRLVNNKWFEYPGNSRTITVWGNFEKGEILNDFYETLDHYKKVRIVN